MRRIPVAILLTSLGLWAQINTGSISGYVLDPSDKPIPGATVVLEDTARSSIRTIQTSAGYYEFDGLPPAEYRLSATAPSFAQITAPPVRVEVDQRARLDLHATLAVRNQQV